MTTVHSHRPTTAATASAAVSSAGGRRTRLSITAGGRILNLLIFNREAVVAGAVKRRRNDVNGTGGVQGPHHLAPNNLPLWAGQRYREYEPAIITITASIIIIRAKRHRLLKQDSRKRQNIETPVKRHRSGGT